MGRNNLAGEPIQLVQIKKIIQWCDENKKLPSVGKNASDEERKLALQLNSIRTWLKKEGKEKEEVRQLVENLDEKYNEKVKKYGKELAQLVQIRKIVKWCEENDRLPSKSDEISLWYKWKNISQIWLKNGKEIEGKEEVRKMVEELKEKYGKCSYMENIIEIQRWVEENKRLPMRSKSAGEEERRLAVQLKSIRFWLNTEPRTEKQEEVIQIVEELDKKYNKLAYEKHLPEIEKWVEENKRLPMVSKTATEEERILAKRLQYIKRWINSEGEEELKEEIQKIIQELEKKCAKELIQLTQAKEIEIWVNKNGRLPSLRKDSSEEEIKLTMKLNYLRMWLKNEKDIEEKEEVRQILEELNEKYNEKIKKYGKELVQLVQTKEILKWAELNGRLPSRSKDSSEEEIKLAMKLNNLRKWLNNEKEVEVKEEIRRMLEEFAQKYKIQLTIREKRERFSKFVNIEKIIEWTEANRRLPMRTGASEEERKLARKLANIRCRLKDEKDEAIKKEFIQKIEELDSKYGKKKRNSQEIGQATYDATVIECDEATRAIKEKINEQSKAH